MCFKVYKSPDDSVFASFVLQLSESDSYSSMFQSSLGITRSTRSVLMSKSRPSDMILRTSSRLPSRLLSSLVGGG